MMQKEYEEGRLAALEGRKENPYIVQSIKWYWWKNSYQAGIAEKECHKLDNVKLKWDD